MAYSVKEIYFTLQGEGVHTGRPAVFLRFAGCNLWSGREEDRESAVCSFCDTDFVGTDGPGGGKFAGAEDLADAVLRTWSAYSAGGNQSRHRFVVCTGGEPLLQLDRELVDSLHRRAFEIAVETNGTIPPPDGIDWLCVSPKAEAKLVVQSGDELKLVYPQEGITPEDFGHLNFRYFSLQPMDGPDVENNTAATIGYCRSNPRWRLSLQTHKLLGIP